MFFMAQGQAPAPAPGGRLHVPLGFLLLFTREHRVQRLLAYFDLQSYSQGTGLPGHHGQAAFVTGGLWERAGSQCRKAGAPAHVLLGLIYTVTGEETGFLGSSLS